MIKQYQRLARIENVDLVFKDEAISKLLKSNFQKTGARVKINSRKYTLKNYVELPDMEDIIKVTVDKAC